MKKSIKGIGAAVVAGAITLAGVGSALAADIDPNADVSLTINKFEHPGGNLVAGDGTAAATAPEGPLAGVNFSVTPVLDSDGKTIDLGTTAGWATADALISGFPANMGSLQKGTAIPVTTGTGGQVAVPGVTQTLYLVQETGVAESFNGDVLTPVAPFLVTLPYPSADGSWLYDVNVYPKNTTFAAEKTLEEETGAGLGDNTSTWNVTVNIPVNVDAVKAVKVTDTLPTGLQYVADSANAKFYNADGTEVTDFVATVDDSGNPITASYTFEETDNKSLVAGGKLVLELQTKTTALGVNGELTNSGSATLTPESGDEVTIDTGVSEVTYWGALKIVKHVEGKVSETLNGAEFQVFEANSSGACEGNLGSPVTVNGNSTFTTATDGTVTIAGLNAKSQAGATYCLKETKAPAGYVASEDYIPVTVTPNGTASSPVSVNVPNPAVQGPTLPGLGATGSVIALALGAALIIGGAGYLAVTKRKANS